MKACKSRIWISAAALSLAAFSVAACGDDDNNQGTPDASNPPTDGNTNVDTTVRVPASITANTTWTADKTYILATQQPTVVKSGATLTIEPGTKIQGEYGSLLMIARGAKILAQGTKDKPIVFTSAQADNRKTKGFWGGLLVLGKAPVNNGHVGTSPTDEATFEAFPPGNADGTFGGADKNDDSGVIKYVRIEFAGFPFQTDREFNNLTLCGVGDKTVVDFVQVHGGSDDGIELFGGTVNVKHIVATQNQDDGFDTDNGWVGKAQFVIVQNVDPQSGLDASNGYESDNHAPAPAGTDPVEAVKYFNADPRTLPTVYNVTLVGKFNDAGARGHFAAVFRRGTAGHYFNHIFADFATGIEIRDDKATKAQLENGNLFLKSSIFFKSKDAAGAAVPEDKWWPKAEAANDIDERALLMNQDPVTGWKNRYEDPALTDPFNLMAPNFKPKEGSPALKDFAVPENTDGSTFFDTTVSFVGAMGADDWTQGWTAYPQPGKFGG